MMVVNPAHIFLTDIRMPDMNVIELIRRLGEQAKELLVSTDKRIREISKFVGFDNPKQFGKVFRESEGITAMEYRQKHASI